jgi:4-amino-4-deoxy-L-arabinose transferase-like glycosyltransferase
VILVYFVGLDMPLVGPDEPRYSQVAREMFERGDWITPTLAGFNWFEKPALLYWLQISSFNLFGVSEFAARFGSALFGLGTIASLWILGRYLDATNEEAGTANSFANWLALMAASTVGIIAFAHGASFDIILTFPATAALVCFFIYDLHRRKIPLVAFYFFVGLALLAKGLVGIIFPFAIVGFYHLIAWRRPAPLLIASAFWGTALSLVIAGSWYFPMYMRHGHEFVDQFFIQHHFQRFTSNKYLHPQPFYFFFWVLPLMTVPWVPFFLAALWNLGGRFVRGETGRDSVTGRLELYTVAWIAVPLVFFSFSGSKLPGYILPVVPAAIILTALYVHRFVQNNARRKFAIRGLAGATLVVCMVAATIVAPRFAKTDSVKNLFATADERGFVDVPVMMLHGISHNAEFYAAGRIVREADGTQKRFPGPHEVAAELRQSSRDTALVIVPVEYLAQLLNSDAVGSELILDNGEVALVMVRGPNAR